MKRIKALVAAAIMAGTTVSYAVPASAETLNFSKPTYIYGAGLGNDEIRRTGELLGLESMSNITMEPVTGNDLDRFIGNPGTYTTDGEMISSVVVAKAPKGTGLDVNITTPANITQIRKYQYENACITAGISDVYVNVGAIRPVTGESALAGIYKAFEVNSVVLDKKRMEVAQKELEVTNKIIQNNIQNNTQINNNTNINSNNTTINNDNSTKIDNSTNINNNVTNIEINQQLINELIIAIKSEVGEKSMEAEKAAKPLTKEEINAIIEEKIKEKNLENNINQETKIELSNVMEQYSKTDAVKSEDVQKQLDELDKKVKEDPKQTSSNTENTIIKPIDKNESTTLPSSKPSEKTPEVSEDGFTVRRGGIDVIKPEFQRFFLAMPEGTEFIVMTVPEYFEGMKFNPEKAENVQVTEDTKKYLPMSNDFLKNINEPGFSADYYDGEKYITGMEVEQKDGKIDYINVRSQITDSELGPDLNPFAKAVFNAYTSQPKSYIDALVKQMKGNEEKVGILQIGEQLMVLKYRNDTADAYLLSEDSTKIMDPMILEFHQRYLHGEEITTDPQGTPMEKTPETTVKNPLATTMAEPGTEKETTTVTEEDTSENTVTTEEVKVRILNPAPETETTSEVKDSEESTAAEIISSENTSSENTSEDTTIETGEKTDKTTVPETKAETSPSDKEMKNLEDILKEEGKAEGKLEDLLKKRYVLVNDSGKKINEKDPGVSYVEFRDGKMYSVYSPELLNDPGTEGHKFTEKGKDTIEVESDGRNGQKQTVTITFTKEGFVAHSDGSYAIFKEYKDTVKP